MSPSTSRSSSCATRCAELQREHPQVEIAGLGQDFSTRARASPPSCSATTARCSSTPARASATSRPTRRSRSCAACARAASGGGLLIGVDLVKPRADPRSGLRRRARRHRGVQPQRAAPPQPPDRQRLRRRASGATSRSSTRRKSRIEMHLEAREALAVRWPGGERRFAAGERIHTENSCKYTAEGVRRPAASTPASTRRAAGPIAQEWFAVFWAPAR